jgi:hypothetical protein
MKFGDVLEGIESSFLSDENVTLELLDFEYRISRFLTGFSNRSLIFKNPGEEKNRFIFFVGRRNGSELSKIIFHQQSFLLKIKNLLQLEIPNVHFIFLSQNLNLVGCLICYEETENTLNLTILKLSFVNFESISALAYSLDERDFSLVNFEGYNFIIDLERIIIFIGYFQNFLIINWIVPELEYGFSNRFIRVRNLSFLAGEPLTIVRNTLKNLNVSFESSSFDNVKVFEIDVLSTDIHFVDCAILVGEEQSPLSDRAKSFFSINNSNIIFENSSFSGDYSINNENYKFFISKIREEPDIIT